LFRAAFASAVHANNEDEIKAFAAVFNAKAGTAYSTKEEFQRLFGVKLETVKRVLVL